MTPSTPAPQTSSDTDPAAPAARRRAPRRPAKPDAVLAAAVDQARSALLEVAAAEEIGGYVGAAADAERLVTHRFTALKPGYRGWQWYATVARVPRSKKVTVSEVGLLPSEESLLAPEWVPWSERIRPEDIAAEQEQQAAEERAREQSREAGELEGQQPADHPDAETSGAGEDD